MGEFWKGNMYTKVNKYKTMCLKNIGKIPIGSPNIVSLQFKKGIGINKNKKLRAKNYPSHRVLEASQSKRDIKLTRFECS